MSRVVEICQELIRFDTQNYGDDPRTQPELEAARWVEKFIRDCGFEPELIESTPGRANVIVRIPGADPDLPTLLIHGHLDVVPAVTEEWSVDPFAGVIKDGYLWGRGAVDMKNMVAMMLAMLEEMGRSGWRPRRTLAMAFFADEEAGGLHGAHWLVKHRPEIFEGVTEAISEVGGYSVTIGGRRVYLVQTGEKGMSWLQLVASGTAGHGSQVNPDNAVTRLAAAVARIGTYEWPLELTETVRELLSSAAEIAGLPFDETRPETIDAVVGALGPAARFVGATLRTGSNPSQLNAGYKVNVIPSEASATIDMRPTPGMEDKALEEVERLAGDGVEVTTLVEDWGYEVPFDTPLVEAMHSALKVEDPEAIILPYLLSAGTDNKALRRVGIVGYGFVPVSVPADYDFPAMFHGVDERIPVEALDFGLDVLTNLVKNY